MAMSNALFPPGTVIPAHPLALDRAGTVDWRAQRALSRYYLAAGAHGLAVGVHTTQFPLHDDRALFADVLRLAVEAVQPRTTTLIAGVTGPVGQAVEEACAARDLGYDAVLLSLHGCAADESEGSLVERASAVGEILPTVAFYMQESVGGRYLSSHYWRRIFDLESTVAVKLAPFDRYRTAEAANAVLSSDRWREITVLTGNDDAIVADLLSDISSMSRAPSVGSGSPAAFSDSGLSGPRMQSRSPVVSPPRSARRFSWIRRIGVRQQP